MSKKNITTKQQLLDMVHSKPKCEEETQQEVDKRNLELLYQLHEAVGERIANVEQIHEDQKSENLHRIAVGMLDIDLHKEMRCVEEMIQEKQKQHDILYNSYTLMERRVNFMEERKKCLIDRVGTKDAAVVMDTVAVNQQEKDQQRKELQKKLNLL